MRSYARVIKRKIVDKALQVQQYTFSTQYAKTSEFFVVIKMSAIIVAKYLIKKIVRLKRTYLRNDQCVSVAKNVLV